jgi:hypothetical protein
MARFGRILYGMIAITAGGLWPMTFDISVGVHRGNDRLKREIIRPPSARG